MSQWLAPVIKPLARNWARGRVRRIKSGEPLATLRRLLEEAQSTHYGRAYGFAEIVTQSDLYRAYCERVPLIDYQAWVSWLEAQQLFSPENPRPLENVSWPGRIHMYCLSSGTTTGRTKYVPYSERMAAVNRSAAIDFFAGLLATQPVLAPPMSKTLYMSGSTRIEPDAQGVIAADMSGLTKYLAPKYLASITLPPHAIAALEPWERRLEALVELCLSRSDIGVLSGIPIWQLTLLEAVQAATGKPIAETMPGLRALIHGGMSIEPYRARLRQLLGEEAIFLETYAASEIGIGAFQLPGESGMRFFQNYQVFYEFEDDLGQCWQADQLEVGRSYGVIVSTCSGLWRYRIGDRLTFRSIEPLILDRVSRDKTTSAFDEKVTEPELEFAMLSVQPSFTDFSLGPDIANKRHVWFVIGQPPPENWVLRLDSVLREQNQDYDDYRGDGRIGVPKVVGVADRSAYLSALGRAEGGQRKFPRLLSPDEVAQMLDTFADSS